MARYESHITIERPNNIIAVVLLENIAKSNNMKLTYVADDAVLGVGKWYYINGYDTDFNTLLSKVKDVSEQLKTKGFNVIREKIEQIMYDTKTGYFECGVECKACLLD